MKVVLASNNAGKIRELNQLLNHLHIELVPQSQMNVDEVAETGATFIENALIKARHAARIANLPAIADDSGLVVPILNGAPGIYSARYAGENANDANNIKKLLRTLESVNDQERQAYFYCALVFLSHADDPTPLVCTGKWEGTLLHAPQGNGGFGYDPLFYVAEQNKTAAELAPEIKNKLSHRGQALQLLLNLLPEKL